MKKALLQQKLNNNQVRCGVCAHRCTITPNQRGVCGVRENQAGTLYALNYGKAIATQVDPIEKKPLYHFLPGSRSYSIATVGCNFRCYHCQNADIAQPDPEGLFSKTSAIPGQTMLPETIVKEALRHNCQSIAYTYTEPTIFLEYALDTMKLAQASGLKNIFVSNGYMTAATTKLLVPYLNAINIDLKAFANGTYLKICGAKLQPVLDTLKLMKKNKIWVEVTSLIIPTVNDSSKEIAATANFITTELGLETPWHLSRFHPAHKMTDVPSTPSKKLHEAYSLGKKAGLKYVYVGNVPGDKLQNTLCPRCNELAIERHGIMIERYDEDGKCSKCKKKLAIIK
ncbi:AmmeMemoRadiSam system radical SAM enzyme [Patescibacteria group bacterium]|nr:AmmeMemoRadiSam system radical SAM enzyme [Patescibacteria group bacterium]